MFDRLLVFDYSSDGHGGRNIREYNQCQLERDLCMEPRARLQSYSGRNPGLGLIHRCSYWRFILMLISCIGGRIVRILRLRVTLSGTYTYGHDIPPDLLALLGSLVFSRGAVSWVSRDEKLIRDNNQDVGREISIGRLKR